MQQSPSRPAAAPILVVRDWETKDADQYQKYLKGHPYSLAVTMPVAMCNPQLGTGWAGIERYLPTAFIEAMVPSEDRLVRGDGTIEPDKASLARHKQAMARSFDIETYPASHLEALARWIDEEVERMLAPIPTSEFL